MTKVFRALAFLVAGLVVVQAASMVWGIAGLGIWVSDGNTLTNEVFEDAFEGGERPFPEFLGLMIHGMAGMMVIPLVALVTMVAGFFAKSPRSSAYGAAIFLLVILQVALGLFGHENALFGLLHGVNALVLFSVAAMAGVTARHLPTATTDERRTMVSA